MTKRRQRGIKEENEAITQEKKQVRKEESSNTRALEGVKK